jgi:hypothetical protein
MPAYCGARRVLRRGGRRLDPDAAALIARMSVAPDGARASLISTTIASLKAAGLWSKFDFLYFLAAHDAQAGRLNWTGAAGTLVATNSPTFTADRGYAGDSVSACLIGDAWTTATKHTQNSNHSFIYVNTNTGTGNGDFGSDAAVQPVLIISVSPTSSVRNSTTTSDTTSTASSIGFIGGTRLNSSGFTIQKDTTQSAVVRASAATPAGAIAVLRAGGNFTNRRVAFACTGSGLTDAEALSLNTIVSNYVTAIGAN